jgi:hypothetical protein
MATPFPRIPRSGVRIGVDQYHDKRNHAEENGGWVTLAIRPEGIARNGMVHQYLSPDLADRLVEDLQAAITKARTA